MPLRFFRRVRLMPGVRVNLSKSGASLSVGRRGMWYTVGPRGHRVTIGAPGTGLFLTKTAPPAKATHSGRHAALVAVLVLALLAILAIGLMGG